MNVKRILDVKMILLGFALILGLATLEAAPAQAIAQGQDSATLDGQVQFYVSSGERLGDPADYECVGTLIDPKWVLTAKHCITDTGANVDNSGVLVGDRRLGEGESHVLDSITLNPGTDTALLELEDPVSQPNLVVGYGLGTPARGTNVAIRGWGSASGQPPRPFLQVATMRTFDTQAPVGPRLVLSNIGQGYTELGDSGAGIYLSGRIYGVLSSGDVNLAAATPTNDIAPWIQQVSGVNPSISLEDLGVLAEAEQEGLGPLTVEDLAGMDGPLTVEALEEISADLADDDTGS